MASDVWRPLVPPIPEPGHGLRTAKTFKTYIALPNKMIIVESL